MTQIVVDSVYRRNLYRYTMVSLWAYIDGLNNPCGPGAEKIEPVIVNTGGPPMPRSIVCFWQAGRL